MVLTAVDVAKRSAQRLSDVKVLGISTSDAYSANILHAMNVARSMLGSGLRIPSQLLAVDGSASLVRNQLDHAGRNVFSKRNY